MADVMAWKDVLQYLFDREKARRGGVLSHEEFADRHGIPRPTVTQMLSGKQVPSAKTMWKMLELEGYDLGDCLELPEQREEREARRDAMDEALERKDEYAAHLRWAIDALMARVRERTTVTDKPPPRKGASKTRRVG